MRLDFTLSIQLENETVRLQPLGSEHYQELLPIVLANPNLLAYSPSLFGTKAHLKTYLEKALTARSNKQRYPFAIFSKADQVYVGSSSFGGFSFEHERLEIGWTWLGRAYQGKGLNAHVKYLMLDYAFHTLQMKRVEFKTDARNKASRRALEKIGAVREGILRSHTIMPDGHRRDSVYYSILAKEWEVLKG